MYTAPGNTASIRYRPYIDGLRGVSIIAVVLYHAKLFSITGGFVGVDVFFVISGFLISSIVLHDVRTDRFSLGQFWERRVRRIIPPLFVVMLACAIGGYFLMLYPQDYHHLGTALTAQSFFASNILFLFTDNYFDQASRYSPLLHTWSLSVEEQFYVLFPLFVLGCAWLASRALKRNGAIKHTLERVLLYAIVPLSILSFLLSVLCINLAPSSAFIVPFLPRGIFWDVSLSTAGFYLLFTRAWEIGIGIALTLIAPQVRSRAAAEILSFGGLVAIIASVFLYHDATPFPGIAAAVPTLGTASILLGQESHPTMTGRLLSWPALVWVGLISYSLYLWHWPIFVFAALISTVPLTWIDMVALVALSFSAAWVSYLVIETPIRKREIFKSRRSVFVAGASAMVFIAVLGIVISKVAFTDLRGIPPAAVAVADNAGETAGPVSPCFQFPGDATSYGGLCRIGDQSADAKVTFIVWGDSHADALTPLLDQLAKGAGVQGIVFVGGSCAPVTGVWESPPATDCARENQNAISYIEHSHVKTIFLIARWSYYVTGGPDAVRVALLTDSGSISATPQQSQEVLERHLVSMTQMLASQSHEIYIVKQVPEQTEFDTRSAFYTIVDTGKPLQSAGISTSSNATYQAMSDQAIEAASGTPDVHIIDPTPLLCNASVCPLMLDGSYLYRDENHLSETGAVLLKPLFAPIFAAMKY